uniref:Uncharacterized protein n=1 Tax=Parascaris equorum TaxID=6256 RepID=A0A914S4Q2_PAREQ
MNAESLTVSSVQRQLSESWSNREYGQGVADNIKHIADFLSNFEFSCRNKIDTLNDKVNLLERKVEFLEARVSLTFIRFTIAHTLCTNSIVAKEESGIITAVEIRTVRSNCI